MAASHSQHIAELPGLQVSAQVAVSAIRLGEGPRLLHVRTYRITGHTSTDAAAWRPKEEVDEARSRDPIARLGAILAERGIGPSELGTGQVVRIGPSGTKAVIAAGLSFPTAITLGPDGALYVSNLGFGGPAPGLGQILRITIPH